MGNKNNCFVIELPEKWDDRSTYTFLGPEEHGVQHMLTLAIDRSARGIDLTTFARERIDALSASLQGLEILKENQKSLPNGTRVYEMNCRWIPVDGKVLFQRHFYMIIDDVGYTFSGTFAKQTLKTIGVEIEQAINSFRPLSPPAET